MRMKLIASMAQGCAARAGRLFWCLAGCLALTALAPAASAQPALSADKPSYREGETISITFANGPGNITDWVGLYPAGSIPGSATPSTRWAYVDGTQTGGEARQSGTLVFTNGVTSAGEWVAHFMDNDSYNIIASVNFTVTVAPLVTLSKGSYATNETISVTFANGPGNAKDWIGLYKEGQTPGSATPSAVWAYVDGAQAGNTAGLTSGTLVFTNGLPSAGNWVVNFLSDDSYTVIASAAFSVSERRQSLLSVDHLNYFALEPITVTFTNGPANPKDWVGIYPEGIAPGELDALIWKYTDSAAGNAGRAHGSVVFTTGLTNTGNYAAYLLENDTYSILASNAFSVVDAFSPLIRSDKRQYETRQDISITFSNTVGNLKDWIGIYPEGSLPGPATPSTVWLYLDGTQTGSESLFEGTVTFLGGVRNPGNWTAYLLENDGYTILAQEAFTVVPGAAVEPTNNIVLPAPLYFEDFDSTAEGALPTGWTEISYTEVLNEELNLADLNSKSYATWVTVAASRFSGPLMTYSNPDGMSTDYQRVLTPNLENRVNGQIITNLATGNMLFGNSGYRNGRSQVLYAISPDYNLTGKTNVHLSFHSLFEQNQDSMGIVEYSIDKGTNWLPLVYMIERSDVILGEGGAVDVEATLTTERSDIAYYDDPITFEPKGGTYGSFIGAPISPALAPFISGRVDDDSVGSKRVELFRLSQADNQPAVRVRFGHAGTDSWYFGIDDVGIYSMSASEEAPRLAVTRAGNQITLSWPASASGYVLESSAAIGAAWTPVAGVAGNTATITIGTGNQFYRLKK